MTFEEFAATRMPAMLKFAAVLAGDRASAEDLAQEVLVRAYSRWDRIGCLDRPEFYVRKMVLNEFLSWRRRSLRQAPANGAAEHSASRAPDHADAYTERQALLADISYTISRNRHVVIGIERCAPGCPGSPGIVQGHKAVLGSVIEYSAATGYARVLYAEPPLPGTSSHRLNSAWNNPLWTSDSGHTVLLYCFQHRPATAGRKGVTLTHVIVLDNGRVARELPWLAGTVNDTTVFPGMVNVAAGIPALPLNP